MSKSTLAFLFSILIFFTQGCALINVHQFAVRSDRPLASLSFYETLDKYTAKEKIRDASTTNVKGFPYLRTNRFLSGFKDQNLTVSQANLWIDHMFALSLDSRRKEILNLSESSLEQISLKLGTKFTRENLFNILKNHSSEMLENDKEQLDFTEKVRLAVKPPTEYSITQRILGLYPLFYFPVKKATLKAQEEFKTWHQQPFDSYTPLGRMEMFGSETFNLPAGFFKTSVTYDGLGVPRISEKDLRILAQAFAPFISQDIAGDYDHFGEIFWQNDHVTINTKKPTVYYYPTHAFIKNQPVLQLNYSLWYTGRFGPNTPWLERGALDGLTFRITFNREGTPLLLDVINNCACYHFYIPDRKMVAEINTVTSGAPPLISRCLPEQYPRKPLQLKITTGWHQVQRIAADDIKTAVTPYQLLPYHILESLPHRDGRHESVFNTKGIMKNSYRIEPYLFFPSGIAKVGYMRQRGNHPVKLIGQAHFTDSHLLDDLFEFID